MHDSLLTVQYCRRVRAREYYHDATAPLLRYIADVQAIHARHTMVVRDGQVISFIRLSSELPESVRLQVAEIRRLIDLIGCEARRIAAGEDGWPRRGCGEYAV